MTDVNRVENNQANNAEAPQTPNPQLPADMVTQALFVHASLGGAKGLEQAANSMASKSGLGSRAPGDDPWANFPWPTDPNSKDPSSSYDSSVPKSQDKYLEKLYRIFHEFEQYENDPQMLSTITETLVNYASDPNAMKDPAVQAFFNNFKSDSGSSMGTVLANVLVQWEFGSSYLNDGKDLTQALADTQKFLAALYGKCSGILPGGFGTDLKNQLDYWSTHTDVLPHDFIYTNPNDATDPNNGSLFYFDSQGLPHFCDADDWTTFIGGIMGSEFSSSNMGSSLDTLFYTLFNIQTQSKNPLYRLVILLTMLKDKDYADNNGGLGFFNKWLTSQTNSLDDILSNYNNAYMSADPDNAYKWMTQLKDFLDSAQNNPAADGGLSSELKSMFKQVWDIPSAGTGSKTIGQLYVDATGPNADGLDPATAKADLTAALKSFTDSTNKSPPPVLDALNQGAKNVSNQAASSQQEVQVNESDDTQILNFFKATITDPTTGYIGAVQTFVQNQKTS